MTPKHFSDRIRSYDLSKINYTKKLKKKKENCALPLLPRYAGTCSRTYGECEKHMYKKHTNCILCDQIGRSYSQPLVYLFKNWNSPVSRPYCFFKVISNYMGPSYLYISICRISSNVRNPITPAMACL